MYTLDHIDISDGSIIHEMFNFLEAIEKFSQIRKHHPTFYSANFQQYNIIYFESKYVTSTALSTQQLPLM